MLYFAIAEPRPVHMVVRYGKNAYYRVDCSFGGYFAGLPMIESAARQHDFVLLGGGLMPFDIVKGDRPIKEKLCVFLQQPEEGPRIKEL